MRHKKIKDLSSQPGFGEGFENILRKGSCSKFSCFPIFFRSLSSFFSSITNSRKSRRILLWDTSSTFLWYFSSCYLNNNSRKQQDVSLENLQSRIHLWSFGWFGDRCSWCLLWWCSHGWWWWCIIVVFCSFVLFLYFYIFYLFGIT